MKQKRINDILYVFDITPYQITQDTDAEVIKVQEECVAGFKELNESLADKIVAYNYHVMCANVPEWAPYVDEPDLLSPELAWSANSATVTIGADDNVFPTLSNPHSVTVTYSSLNTDVATIDPSTGEITLVATGSASIWASFDGDDTYEAQAAAYELTVQAAQQEGHTLSLTGDCSSTYLRAVRFNITDDQGIESSYANVSPNTPISIEPMDPTYPAGSPNWTITRSDGGAVNYDPSISSYIYFLDMPDNDLTINFAWTEPQENTEQPE